MMRTTLAHTATATAYRRIASTSAALLSTKATSSAPAPRVTIPPQRPSISDPKSFLQAISRGPRRQLQENAGALTALSDTWEGMWGKVLNGQPAAAAPTPSAAAPGTTSPRAGKQINKDLKASGVTVKDRRYILWALEKFRQGQDPAQFSLGVKPKKKIRGWGPRVQNGIRVRGRKRPGEK
ncbi:hypothetical protein A4X13_0g3094 [Tilletia indica]|uniref:Small ribosomal subunit protein mS41 n=1 Tax=Tilletia indica TaxID=43049 RepID=A0A177TR76_9BASI|nr:hypothetical protein A4X13_0g3094 [Tilletia indica]